MSATTSSPAVPKQDEAQQQSPPASEPPAAPAAATANPGTATNSNNLASRRVTISHSSNGASQEPNSQAPAPNAGTSQDLKAQQQTLPPQSSLPMSGHTIDVRRNSMNSSGFMDDSFFTRRSSIGFDMGMEGFFNGRRDSMDSAAIDAAIVDLSRRRLSAAHMPSMTDMPPAMGYGTGMMGSAPQGGGTHENITQRQQQLQQQQRELEQRQKELEFQRQQLIASMQERSYATPHHPGAGMHRGSLGMGGSLGLGSVHSQGSGQMPSVAPHRSSGGSAGTSSSNGQQHWWVCQVCNSKAFASQDEAVAHEATCQERQQKFDNGLHNGMPPMHNMDMMGRNFSMGLGSGIDSSQRSLGYGGMGTVMDNSARGVVSMGMDSSRGAGSLGLDSSRMSMGMDSSGGHSYPNERTMSVGPFAMLNKPMPLSMLSDKDWLTPLHCFVRRHCVEVFTATENDVATPSKGKRKPIQVGQIGIRCPHCHSFDSNGNSKARERGSVYYPTTISSIYNATMNLLQRHLHSCPAVPSDVMRRYETLKADDARSGTSKRYWIESAHSLGLVDTPNGIRHSALRPPPLPTLTRQQETTGQTRRNSNEFFSTKSNAMDSKDGGDSDSKHGNGQQGAPLVTKEDKPYATTFSYHLLSQMQPCVFTEADRLGKRKGLPPGFPGLACRHCFGGYGSGRFFPSSIKTLSDTSKTLNVLHNHMMRCRKCPADVKESLEKLRSTHDEERAKMKFGSQKAFFARIWERLHGKDHPGSLKRAQNLNKRAAQQRQQQQHAHMLGMNAMPPQQNYHVGNYQQPHYGNGLEALAAASSPASKKQRTG